MTSTCESKKPNLKMVSTIAAHSKKLLLNNLLLAFSANRQIVIIILLCVDVK